MTVMQLVTQRQLALVYDGTNAEEIVDMVNTQLGCDLPENMFVILAEDGGSLTVNCPNGPDPEIVVVEGDYVFVGGGYAGGVPASQFGHRFTVLGDA